MLSAFLPRARTVIPVRRLFLKIFLWFWLTNLGVFAAIALSSHFMGMHVVSQPNMYATVAPILAAEAVRAFESGGQKAFIRFSQSNVDDKERQLYLLDGFGKDVLGRRVSEEGLRIALAVKSGQLLMLRSHIAAYRLTSPAGRPYILLLYINPLYAKEILLGRGLLFPLSLFLLVTLLCLWLASHIASPIHALQFAARSVSRGDLSSRVPEPVLARHDEIADLGADFNSMVAWIEILVRSHKDLLAAVSHELRSPLTRLNLSLALLKRSSSGGDDLLQRMDRDISTIDILMGQLLTLSRFEAGISGMQREPVNLAQLVEQIGADGSFEGRPSNKAVTVTIRDTIHLAEADSYALHSACENIVRNAIRFTHPDTTIEIELALDQDLLPPHATIAVRDQGPGVPEDLLRSIFDPFFRVHQDGVTAKGNGLGLAIASGAVHLHHGHISARNRPAGGLEVLMHLPLNGRKIDQPA